MKISNKNATRSTRPARPSRPTRSDSRWTKSHPRQKPKYPPKNTGSQRAFRQVSNNYAFVDSQNLNLSIRALGWKLDFKRFGTYLREKYGVRKAFLFIGYIEGNTELYKYLQDAGFICIFKPTLTYKDGTTKGNCDADLVLQAMIEYSNYQKAVIVTGDGDFYCLVNYLIEKSKLEAVLVPNGSKFSALLKFKHVRPHLRYMNELKNKLRNL